MPITLRGLYCTFLRTLSNELYIVDFVNSSEILHSESIYPMFDVSAPLYCSLSPEISIGNLFSVILHCEIAE